VQNSTAVFQLNFSNNINFCASISRPNAKPQTVNCNIIISKLISHTTDPVQSPNPYGCFLNQAIQPRIRRKTLVNIKSVCVPPEKLKQ
jgi:hypothetical protein